MSRKIKVIVVDDSAVVRNILVSNLKKYDDIEILGAARDPYEARDMIVKFKPDVIILDIEMPKMSGLEFIDILMKNYPLPIVVVSSLVSGKCETSLKALELGAVEILAKPQMDLSNKLPLLIDELHEKIIAASNARIYKIPKIENINKNTINTTILSEIHTTDKIIAIGASTGGTEAI
ncbi:MAG TPA: response regulator, partial [bacterium]|nr:response regulator [bacterium]